MAEKDLVSMLVSDSRFTKSGTKFQKTCAALSDVLSLPNIAEQVTNTPSKLKRLVHFVNILQYANQRGDSLSCSSFDETQIQAIISEGLGAVQYEDVSDLDLRDSLGYKFLDYREIVLSTSSSSTSNSYQKLKSFLAANQATVPVESVSQPAVVTSSSPQIQTYQAEKSSFTDDLFWANSVSLDFPIFPQPNSNEIVYEHRTEHHHYCIYGDGVLPWTQSQISCVTDVNRFSDQDILQLFPPMRLYTRGAQLYQECEKVELDDDLGLIFPIKGFNKRQIKKNIIEYPHLDGIDRIVKIKGQETTIPFWKYIEIDGEMHKTADVWDELEDTKKLPKSAAFMREYVTRKYILEETVKGVEHKYSMRGTLLPFLTLYNTPDYYESHGYDPVEIGRKCVVARQSYKYSRNPVIKMINDAKLSV